jgi:hypothetical protein
MTDSYKIATTQVNSTGNILGIATVERLDRIVLLLEAILAAVAPPSEGAKP